MKAVLTGLGTLLGIVVIVAGFISYAGLPPYMSKDEHSRDVHDLTIEIAGGAAQFYQYKGDQIQDQIWRLEDQKREMIKNVGEKKEWFKYFEPRLRELKKRQQENEKVLKQQEEKLKK